MLVLDEIYTGFGRTGKWFACEYSGVIPDVICLGKALTGGFPLSACVGRADLMDTAWPASTGEAIHTSTFLGHPVGCAMALAQIAEIEKLKLPDRAAALGAELIRQLSTLPFPPSLHVSIRGMGLMVGVELKLPNGQPATETALQAIKALLYHGFIMLPEGEHSNVIGFTPPLTITKAQLTQAVNALASRGIEHDPYRNAVVAGETRHPVDALARPEFFARWQSSSAGSWTRRKSNRRTKFLKSGQAWDR